MNYELQFNKYELQFLNYKYYKKLQPILELQICVIPVVNIVGDFAALRTPRFESTLSVETWEDQVSMLIEELTKTLPWQ